MPKDAAKDEIVHPLDGLGAILMSIDAHVEAIDAYLGGDDGEEEEDDA